MSTDLDNLLKAIERAADGKHPRWIADAFSWRELLTLVAAIQTMRNTIEAGDTAIRQLEQGLEKLEEENRRLKATCEYVAANYRFNKAKGLGITAWIKLREAAGEKVFSD